MGDDIVKIHVVYPVSLMYVQDDGVLRFSIDPRHNIEYMA